MWIVDSSVWIAYFGGEDTSQTRLLDAALGQRLVGLGDIILCEVLQGYRHSHDFDAARQALLQFPIYTIGGQEIAIQSAQNFRTLRQMGITVRKTIDCLIATFVIERDLVLLHNDRDFDAFEKHLGLHVMH